MTSNALDALVAAKENNVFMNRLKLSKLSEFLSKCPDLYSFAVIVVVLMVFVLAQFTCTLVAVVSMSPSS